MKYHGNEKKVLLSQNDFIDILPFFLFLFIGEKYNYTQFAPVTQGKRRADVWTQAWGGAVSRQGDNDFTLPQVNSEVSTEGSSTAQQLKILVAKIKTHFYLSLDL